MLNLLKKEFSLCLHPTCFLFLTFAAFVFIPNYPYEVMFFFSGLSVFFVCLTARENGDLPFSCTLPVKKRDVAVARICFCMIFQLALLALAGITTAVKETCFSAATQVNMAGSTANLAFLGYGLILLGTFNLIFFPWYFKKPVNVGIPFLVASAVEFFIIALLIALRFAVPLFSETLCSVDPANMGAKAVVFCLGLALYAGFTAGAVVLSAKRFERTDL